MKIVDTYGRSVKRKRDENDSVFEMDDSEDIINKRRRVDDENDSGLEVIDSYDRKENKIKRGVEKKNRVKNRKFRKYSDDDQRNPNLKVIDTYERSAKRKRDENDSDLEIIDSYDRDNKKKKRKRK